MAYIKKFEIFSVDLPFKKPFKHSAAVRSSSSSLFLKCITSTGHIGFGETLPREYVTGESRDSTFTMLKERILPRLVGMSFENFDDVKYFLQRCDGRAPQGWVDSEVPQTAAWCAVDLALLDAFGKVFEEPVRLNDSDTIPADFRYSPVISADKGLKFLKTLLKIRFFGSKQVKLKIGGKNDDSACRLTRMVLGKNCDIRVDANMAWDRNEGLRSMKNLAKYGITSFEQPLKADDLDGLAMLTKETGLGVMIDEGLSDGDSLAELIRRKACTAVNVRISKCGGLMAAYNRCREARAAGLTVQLGCLTGESSLLSAANLILLKGIEKVTYGESCFGLFLLKDDPVVPLLQFGPGGVPPELPHGYGLGITVDENKLSHWTGKYDSIIEYSTIKEN